ncbi:hypothetical protein C8R43DRAFT_1120743 [Mycena crocata]|nr:hypothetical protein C8R43DRAFT_1120743 [Mycena crocata]
MSGGKRKREPQRQPYIHDASKKSIAQNATNRRMHTEINPAPPRSPEKRAFDNFDVLMGYAYVPDDAGSEQPPAREGPAAIKVKVKVKAKRYEDSDYRVKAWIPLRDSYADGLMRRQGRGPWWQAGCAGCGQTNPQWRCEDCFASRMLCGACIVERHRDEPLHFLQEWENGFFQGRCLRDLNMRYQIGHPGGEDCPFVHLTPGLKKFVVLHDNGIHELDIDFCSCAGAPTEVDQLLNIGWFPATSKVPSTAATLSLLRRFHLLNLQARVPAYDFYNTLVLLRHGAGLSKAPPRLPQFMDMVREYRHLMMCIRAGRAHDPTGIAGTKSGELAIPCRCCPHPTINLPEGWENAPPEIAWIYRLMVSKDANFKMKGRDRSSREKDPTLGPGWAYMVASDRYLKYLADFIHEDEISHCVSFAALWSANNKRSKNLRASGVGSVSCSRHELFRPCGTGDLQKGERYSNMDYLFFSSLIGMTLKTVVSSYDIACQWGRNFATRAKAMPKRMQLPEGVKVLFKVPKFHLPPHVKKCHGPYSFNYTKGVGRTDGEGVERNWSWLNWAARFISVMGPGSREDTIDDLCGFSNWKKTVDLGNSLLRKMVLAIPQGIIHSRAFHAFTDGLREHHEEELLEWEKTVRAWEENSELANPYEYPESEAETMADVMQRIAEQDHARVTSKGAAEILIKPAAFLMAGIEIEDNQEAVALEAKRRNRTTIQATTLQRQRTLLLGKISALHDVQGTYMPGLSQWFAQQDPPLAVPDKAKPETIPIYLPSRLPTEARQGICIEGLAAHEDALRAAQAGESLRDLRAALRTRTFAHQFQRKLQQSQGMWTKSRTLTEGIEDRVRAASSRYRMAHAALLRLRGGGDWQMELQELRQEDIRGMNERLMNDVEKQANRKARLLAGLTAEPTPEESVDDYGEPVALTVLFNLETGEGKRELSWIWYTGMAASGTDTAGDGRLHDGTRFITVWGCRGLMRPTDIRVEWMRARARADRWREELILLEEEMRRVIVFCIWKANWWRERVAARPGVDDVLAEGLSAYALEQVNRETRWSTTWASRWSAVRERAGLAVRDHIVNVAEEVLVPLEVDLDDEDEEDYAPDAGYEDEEGDLL